MKYLLRVFLRILSIPLFILIIIIGIIEFLTTIITMGLLGFFYAWIFEYEFEDPVTGSSILWYKLSNLLDK